MTILDRVIVLVLKRIVAFQMRKYPHGKPHPETVAMIANGVLSAIEVSNERLAAYAGEPWVGQSEERHAAHAKAHAGNALLAFRSPSYFSWLADDGTPEISHAILRCMMCLWQHERGRT